MRIFPKKNLAHVFIFVSVSRVEPTSLTIPRTERERDVL